MDSIFIKKHKSTFLILFVIIIILSTSLGILFALDFFSSDLRSPIKIESNDEFLSYNFPGDGTQANPYIIEESRIGASGRYAAGIEISNTNTFFIIRNCFISTNYIGIVLRNVATNTAIIVNNTCVSKSGRGGGIGLSDTRNCTILNNKCRNFMQGIHLNEASHCLIQLNLIEKSNYQGINIRYSSYNIITNNTVKKCPQHGIALVGNARSNIIYNNFLIDNAYSETYEVNGRLTGTINSQAFDEGNYNYWYDEESKQGNWWSDYSWIGNYSIDGPAGTFDIYPKEID